MIKKQVDERKVKIIIYPWAVYWEGPSAFIRGGEEGEDFFLFYADFDADYNGEIKIWIRLPVLLQNSD